MKKQMYYTAISITLILLVMELTYINAKSILYLVAELGYIDKAFAIIGALAFSMVTVLVMRTTSSKWMRFIFPLFDALLVFCGFNVKFANNLLDNPIAFYLTIFYALFVFVIMYGLGKISYERDTNRINNESTQINDETNQKLIESNRIIADLEQKLAESNRITIELKRINDETIEKLNESIRINDETNQKLIESNRIIADLKQKLAESNRINDETRRMAEQFLRNHILYEAWMSKKKSEQNRNGYDARINQLAESIKAGKNISIDEFLQVNFEE